MRKGCVHVYTGNGKGKTTAALGLALRAAGAGHRVFIAQFIKKRICGEHKALERFNDLITIKQYGSGFLKGKTRTKAEITSARKSFGEIRDIVLQGVYDLVILDEINVAAHCGLISIDDILNLLAEKPAATELVLTGRHADDRVMEKADLVTEMKEIKHYFKRGLKSRAGIEC